LGNLECVVANLSSTGAMLRSRTEVAVGREAPLELDLAPSPIITNVRVVRCEAIDVEAPGEAVWRRRDYALGVLFLQPSRHLTATIKTLTKDVDRVEEVEPRILIIGEDDDVTHLAEASLKNAQYHTRVLGHSGYAVATARRIGAKGVVLNLNLGPGFSGRGIVDSLRQNPATAEIPIVICADADWMLQWRATYAAQPRVRLLMVPFTPEQIVAELDGVLQPR
jgi:CheY-like chemotaxis protein